MEGGAGGGVSRYVEVRQRARSALARRDLQVAALAWAEAHAHQPGAWAPPQLHCPLLREHAARVTVEGGGGGGVTRVHVYRADEQGRGETALGEAADGEGDEAPSAARWSLPAAEFEGLWESLVLEADVKERALATALAGLQLSERGLDANVVAVNRVLLLHGPPGTGKTTLCKALAQKISIRLERPTHFVEINSHSLFSKWFSESGKLVTKLFGGIVDIAEDSSALVCVLIDEIESLVHARTASASGSEPSDAIRAVNAVLTQLDRIRRYPNVLILATSNMTGAIDVAFVDRADLKQYIGPPSAPAIYEIYRSCIAELGRVNIVTGNDVLFDYDILKMCGFENNESTNDSLKLLNLAEMSLNFSGRTLRKIPFLTYAALGGSAEIEYGIFVESMKIAIVRHKADSDAFSSGSENARIEPSTESPPIPEPIRRLQNGKSEPETKQLAGNSLRASKT